MKRLTKLSNLITQAKPISEIKTSAKTRVNTTKRNQLLVGKLFLEKEKEID